jgi:AraC-like DNA-binding protein
MRREKKSTSTNLFDCIRFCQSQPVAEDRAPKRRTDRSVRGIRRDWMFEAARESQLLAGRIAADRSSPSPIEVRSSLCASLSEPANDLERYVLEGLIARALYELNQRPSRAFGDTTVDRVPARASSVLRHRFSEHWTIGRLAHELVTNRLRLTTEFKAAFGVGVHRYLIECRINAAEELLGKGEKVESASKEVGFHSKKTLYDAYKRVRGKPLRVSRTKHHKA